MVVHSTLSVFSIKPFEMDVMTKTDWETAYSELDKAHTELSIYDRDYKHGSNKKIRDHAERQMGYVKHRLQYLFNKYPEVYSIVSGGEKAGDFGRALTMDEFFQNRYIVGDLGELLTRMREKIKSFDSSKQND